MIHAYTRALACRMAGRANAWAPLRGGPDYPRLVGAVKFFQTQAGVLVTAEVWGLPGESGFFGLRIRQGAPGEPATGGRDQEGKPRPCHPGDLPPLLSNRGYAWSAFLTGRFTAGEVLGHTVAVHQGPGGFTPQPVGHAGEQIAWGTIR